MKKEEFKRLRKREGITLISLVVVIILILILAGISIAMLSGENGILKQSIQAKEETIMNLLVAFRRH